MIIALILSLATTFSAATHAAPDPRDVREAAATAAYEAGDLDRAAMLYTKLIDSDPTNYPLILKLAAVRMAQGRLAEAESILKPVARVLPHFREFDLPELSEREQAISTANNSLPAGGTSVAFEVPGLPPIVKVHLNGR